MEYLVSEKVIRKMARLYPGKGYKKVKVKDEVVLSFDKEKSYIVLDDKLTITLLLYKGKKYTVKKFLEMKED